MLVAKPAFSIESVIWALTKPTRVPEVVTKLTLFFFVRFAHQSKGLVQGVSRQRMVQTLLVGQFQVHGLLSNHGSLLISSSS